MVLGRDYISKKFSAAVVHIIVSGRNEEESGGTGFLCADYPDQIITAAHVLNSRTVKAIWSRSGEEILLTGGGVKIGDSGLDLAALECHMPAGIEPIRVEWNRDAVVLGAGLTLFGYPKIALHLPSLYSQRLNCIRLRRNIRRRGSRSLFPAPHTRVAAEDHF